LLSLTTYVTFTADVYQPCIHMRGDYSPPFRVYGMIAKWRPAVVRN